MTSTRELWRRVKAPRFCFVLLSDQVAVAHAKAWLERRLWEDEKALGRRTQTGYRLEYRECQGGARRYMGHVKAWLEEPAR